MTRSFSVNLFRWFAGLLAAVTVLPPNAFCSHAEATKRIALTFDDAPKESTAHFETAARRDELIRKLRDLEVPAVLVFANSCKTKTAKQALEHLQKYQLAGHKIGNHTCSHPRLDEVGFDTFRHDVEKNDSNLGTLMTKPKFFRFPFLNEGTDEAIRDRMRSWLRKNEYRHAAVSVDTEDFIYSWALNQARMKGRSINYEKVKEHFVSHVVDSVKYYDGLATQTLGYSPKHTLLLHEMDATVLFLDALVIKLRKEGWIIIGAEEAYSDPLYALQPKNTFGGNGIVAQLALEKTGKRLGFDQFDRVKAELRALLGI